MSDQHGYKREMAGGLRQKASSLLYYSGVWRAGGWWQPSNRRILTYHRVVEPENSPIPIQDGMYVRPNTFRRHLDWLKKHALVISLTEQLAAIKARKPSRQKTVALTFDDGWLDNFEHAVPALIDAGVPATFFLATSFIGTKRLFWTDKIGLFLKFFLKEKEHAVAHSSLTHTAQQCLAIANAFSKDENPSFALEAVLEFVKSLPAATQERVADELLEAFQLPSSDHAVFINWEQARNMQSQGLTFASHSHSHWPFSQLDSDAVRVDYQLSLSTFAAEKIQPLPLFCYPGGYWSEAAQAALAQAGVESCLGTDKHVLERTPALFGRMNMHEDISSTESLFCCRLWVPGFS